MLAAFDVSSGPLRQQFSSTSLMTVGQPRVGDLLFAARFRQTFPNMQYYWRFENQVKLIGRFTETTVYDDITQNPLLFLPAQIDYAFYHVNDPITLPCSCDCRVPTPISPSLSIGTIGDVLAAFGLPAKLITDTIDIISLAIPVCSARSCTCPSIMSAPSYYPIPIAAHLKGWYFLFSCPPGAAHA